MGQCYGHRSRGPATYGELDIGVYRHNIPSYRWSAEEMEERDRLLRERARQSDCASVLAMISSRELEVETALATPQVVGKALLAIGRTGALEPRKDQKRVFQLRVYVSPTSNLLGKPPALTYILLHNRRERSVAYGELPPAVARAVDALVQRRDRIYSTHDDRGRPLHGAARAPSDWYLVVPSSAGRAEMRRVWAFEGTDPPLGTSKPISNAVSVLQSFCTSFIA